MEISKTKKLRDILRQRGFVSALAAICFGILKPIGDKIRGRKENSLVNKISKGSEELITDINGYKMILNSNKSGIHRELIVNAIREPQATKIMKESFKSGDVVLEAGANIGYYALMESSLVGKDGLIYAIEPAKDNFNYLTKNINLNKFKNVFPTKLAMGEKNGVANLNIYDAENWNTIADIPYASKKSQEKVLVKSGDYFFKDKTKPDFIRMDVEGYEYEIFKGMKKLLKTHPPRGLFVEMHFYIMGNEKSIELLKILENNGYEIKHYFLDKKPFPRILLLDTILERLERIKDKMPISFGEIGGVTIKDLINNKNNTRSGAPEIFFELKNAKK